MSALDRDVLAEKLQVVRRHLAYESLDMIRVYRAASDGPRDLLAFLARVRDSLPVTQPADDRPSS